MISKGPLSILALLLCLAVPLPRAYAAAPTTLASARVPDAKKPQGEVRLLLRDDAVVVQTLLHSKILKRVLGVIAHKEKRFWHEKPGQEDSNQYVAALSRSYDAVHARFKTREDRDNRYQDLLIEFVVTKDRAWLEIARPTVHLNAGAFEILRSEPMERLVPARSYVIASLFEIGRDALGLSAAELRHRLEEAGPEFDWLGKEWASLQEKE